MHTRNANPDVYVNSFACNVSIILAQSNIITIRNNYHLIFNDLLNEKIYINLGMRFISIVYFSPDGSRLCLCSTSFSGPCVKVNHDLEQTFKLGDGGN